MRSCVLAAAAIAALSGSAIAGGINVTYRDALSIPFNVGTGNSNTNFAISRDSGSGVELGLKAKERFFGDANVGGAGDLYIVQSGYSPTSGSNPALDPPNAWWNFDFSIDLNGNTFSNTGVGLYITNSANSNVMNIDISAIMVGLGAGGSSVLQDSQNLGFPFFAAPLGFNANDLATYTFRLVATVSFDGVPASTLGDVSMRVQADGHPVPLPSGAGMGFAGLAGLAGLRRRR